jgi:cytidylate kinase
MPIITISRQQGSGGAELARRLAKSLGYRLIDKEILSQVASLARVPVEQVAEFADDGGHAMRRFLHAVARDIPDLDEYYRTFAQLYSEHSPGLDEYVYYGHAPPQTDFSSLRREDCLKFFESAVRDLAERGNVILLGRGSQVLLADFPHTLHVRVTASLKYRINNVARADLFDEKQAALAVAESDRRRARYLDANYGRNVDDITLYDLVLRMDQLSIDQVVEFIHRWAVAETTRHETELRSGDK